MIIQVLGIAFRSMKSIPEKERPLAILIGSIFIVLALVAIIIRLTEVWKDANRKDKLKK